MAAQLGNQVGLFGLVASCNQANRLTKTLLGYQFFVSQVVITGQQALGDIQNGLGRAVIGLQFQPNDDWGTCR